MRFDSAVSHILTSTATLDFSLAWQQQIWLLSYYHLSSLAAQHLLSLILTGAGSEPPHKLLTCVYWHVESNVDVRIQGRLKRPSLDVHTCYTGKH